MTSDDENRSQQLFEILLGRSGRKDQFKAFLEQAASYGEFRVLLVSKTRGNDVLAEVTEGWRGRVVEAVAAPDDRDVMHDLEILAIKQAELEKLLKASEATLIGNLRAVDASATQLAELGVKVREVRTAISEYRTRMAELAASKMATKAASKTTQEKVNGVSRASH